MISNRHSIAAIFLFLGVAQTTAIHAAEYYRTGFEPGTSDWQVSSGDWMLQTTPTPLPSDTGYVALEGSGYLDANPQGQQQHFSAGSIQQTDVITIPADAQHLTLSYRYQLRFNGYADQLQVQYTTNPDLASNDWQTLITHKGSSNHSRHGNAGAGHGNSPQDGSGNNWAYQMLDISAQLPPNQTHSIRLRFNYSYRSGSGPRHIAIDAVRLADWNDNLPLLNSTGAAYQNSVNSLDQRSVWLLNGDWSSRTYTDTDGTEHTVLDANPSGNIQSYRLGQAQLQGGIHIPIDASNPILRFSYRGQLVYAHDQLVVQVRPTSAGANSNWQTLVALHPTDPERTSFHESSLSAWRGENLQVRLYYRYWGINEPRQLQIDDLIVGEKPGIVHSYPYRNPLDTDTQRNELQIGFGTWVASAQANPTGSPTTNSGQRISNTNASGQLDSNPQGVDQAWANNLISLAAPVSIPATALHPILNYRYQQQLLDPHDRLYIDIQGNDADGRATSWQTLGSHSQQYNPNTLDRGRWTTQQWDLSAWRGQTVRIRFRQRHTSARGSRSLQIDDLYLGDASDQQISPTQPWPYRNDFETSNAQQGWQPQGSWSLQPLRDTSDGAAISSGSLNAPTTQQPGHWILDSNVELIEQRYARIFATLGGWIPLPGDSATANSLDPQVQTPEGTANPWVLSYRYRTQQVGSEDYFTIQLQSLGNPLWRDLHRHTWRDDNRLLDGSGTHADDPLTVPWARQQIDLRTWAGQTIRLRVLQHTRGTRGIRRIQLDQLRLGAQHLQTDAVASNTSTPTVTALNNSANLSNFPYLADFDSSNGDWLASGDWGQVLSQTASSSHGYFANNPRNHAQAWRAGILELNGWIQIPSNALEPQLSYQYRAALGSGWNDRVQLQLQTQTDSQAQWRTIQQYGPNYRSSNVDTPIDATTKAGWDLATLDLSPWVGQGIRLRFVQYVRSSEPQTYLIDDLRIEDLQSATADQDGDGIPDDDDPDRDGDGIDNTLDVYPDDPARSLLDAVTNLQSSSTASTVNLQWAIVSNASKSAGYRVYRTDIAEGTRQLLNNELLTNATYADSTAGNGKTYYYDIVAVDLGGREGGQARVSLFIAYNLLSLESLTAQREGLDARIAWPQTQPAASYYYLYRRASSEQPWVQIANQIVANSYLDTATDWTKSYEYQASPVLAFTNSLNGEFVVLEGNRSAVATVVAASPLSITLTGTRLGEDGIQELLAVPNTQTVISGIYSNTGGRANVTAVKEQTTLNISADGGSFRMILPVDNSLGLWLITLNQGVATGLPERSASIQVRVVQDTAAPVMTVNGDTQRTVDADSVTLSGTVLDIGSGLASLQVDSDRYPELSLGVVFGSNNRFEAEVPLQGGSNLLQLVATDLAGNSIQAAVSVQKPVSKVPVLAISSPRNGDTVSSASINVQGTVYSELKADQIRVVLGNQQIFPAAAAADNAHAFVFENIALQAGSNTLTVRVETLAGDVETSLVLIYQTEDTGVESTGGTANLTLSSPNDELTLADDSYTLSGEVSSESGIARVEVNGVTIDLLGTDTAGSFDYQIDLSGLGQTESQEIVIRIIDNQGGVTTRTLRFIRDTLAPQISYNANLQLSPIVNEISETRYVLTGVITDFSLAGMSINGEAISLLPGNAANEFNFSAQIDLQANIEKDLLVESWDTAGNRTVQTLKLIARQSVDLALLTPADDAQYQTEEDSFLLEMIANLNHVVEGATATVKVDNTVASALQISNTLVTGSVTLPADNAQHRVVIEVFNGETQESLVKRTVIVTVNKTIPAPLALESSEPANNDIEVVINTPIKLYFNQPIDPGKLDIEIRETAHGLSYETTLENGAQGEKPKLIEINRDYQPVPGSVTVLTDSVIAAFEAERDFAFGASVYVTVRYDGNELTRYHFKTKIVPTFLQGFLVDSFAEAIDGVTVEIPELKQSIKTDANGAFLFSTNTLGSDALPAGRYRMTINPGIQSSRYGSIEKDVRIEAGRFSQLNAITVPILNPNEPFRRIASGVDNAVLASGGLQLDLSKASLLFPNGRESGDVHVQFTPVQQINYAALGNAIPQWMYALQPGGIKVNGDVSVRIRIPSLYGGYSYLPADGLRVLIVALDDRSLKLVPVGAGELIREGDERLIRSTTPLNINRLDFIGYVLANETLQDWLLDFEAGDLNLQQLIYRLETERW